MSLTLPLLWIKEKIADWEIDSSRTSLAAATGRLLNSCFRRLNSMVKSSYPLPAKWVVKRLQLAGSGGL